MIVESNDTAGPERILIVCTANVCRSPYLAYRLQASLTRRGISGVAINSAGTRAEAGHPMAERIRVALDRRGIDSDGFQTKAVTRELVERAELILTAETAHRSAIVHLVPRALPRVFTVRQFARLIPVAREMRADSAQPIGELRELVAACSAARGTTQSAGGRDDDIDDPWGRSALAYRRAIKTMDTALDAIVAEMVEVTA